MITYDIPTNIGIVHVNSLSAHPHDRLESLVKQAVRSSQKGIFSNDICPLFFQSYNDAENAGKLSLIKNQKIGLYYALPFGVQTLVFVWENVLIKPETFGIESGYVLGGSFDNEIVKKNSHETFGTYWPLCNIIP